MRKSPHYVIKEKKILRYKYHDKCGVFMKVKDSVYGYLINVRDNDTKYVDSFMRTLCINPHVCFNDKPSQRCNFIFFSFRGNFSDSTYSFVDEFWSTHFLEFRAEIVDLISKHNDIDKDDSREIVDKYIPIGNKLVTL